MTCLDGLERGQGFSCGGAGLAKGLAPAEAVGQAKAYVTAAIAAADRLSVGRGPGPLHHFYEWW